MYITTFYSFKGGVGRTMAVVNVAVALAMSGKRVLIVDFDLDAPGVDTFDLPKPKVSVPGIVEYTSDYLQTGAAPDALTYIYEAFGIWRQGGRLWVMPSGRGDDEYVRKLDRIDWQELYGQHQGYLMFENLKLQWKEALDPDYVFIDSRTGYGDIGGICTRHLPDAVVVLFFPNEQNLRGLKRTVRDIRAEASRRRGKKIRIHFVMSNVSTIDDEEHILEGMMGTFSGTLKYGGLAATIHHYDSLAHVNQVIFTLEKPSSRLAREYLSLVDKIVAESELDNAGTEN